ncbi:MAG: flagellar motor switch protein FliG [Arenibacterium sp.]
MQDDGSFAGFPMVAPAPGGTVALGTAAPASLSRRAKAAIVVRYLLNEGADIPLEDLPDEAQAHLTHQMGQMGLVDKATLDAVVSEFAEALEGTGLTFPHGIAGALSMLDGKISPHTASRLRKEAGVRQTGDPWERLRASEVDDLIEIATSESVEVAAVLLSKLETGKAAKMLEKLPGPVARRITYAVSQTSNVTPDAVDRIGLSLAAQLDAKPLIAFESNPDERVGAILNQSPAVTRDDMLSSLDETDAAFAEQVRKQIFTFAHISYRINPRDIPDIVRGIPADTLVVALAGATDDQTSGVAEFFFKNLSQRMSANLQEEVADKGKVKAKDAEAAMSEIVGIIRMMEQNGELEFRDPDEEEENE